MRASRIWRPLAAFAVSALFACIAGCGPVKLTASTNIPEPLVVKIPVAVALFLPKEFSEYVHKEERWSTDWNVDLGKAQSDGIKRLMNAMFERVAQVDSISAGAGAGADVRAILEPSVEEFAFVTPRDAGSPFFAVSIKYRVNVYTPDGRLADSWGFTGYGTAPASGLTSSDPLARATSLALRDAGAKLAVEFREQAIVRGLLPAPPGAETPPPAAATPESPVATLPTVPTTTTPSSTEGAQKPVAAESKPPSDVPASPAPPGNGLKSGDVVGE
jgi:hypothetical protein